MIINYPLIPEGTSGDWSVQRFELTHLHSIRTMVRDGHRWCPPGTYTKLVRDRTVIMSDTQAEINDLWMLDTCADGRVLINGLGLGIATGIALSKLNVCEVTVIERSPDVLKLVAPYFSDPRLTIIEADAYKFKPPKGVRYDFVWHDIWDTISPDNLPEMSKLHRRYKKRCDRQASWARDECRWMRRREARFERIEKELRSFGFMGAK